MPIMYTIGLKQDDVDSLSPSGEIIKVDIGWCDCDKRAHSETNAYRWWGLYRTEAEARQVMLSGTHYGHNHSKCHDHVHEAIENRKNYQAYRKAQYKRTTKYAFYDTEGKLHKRFSSVAKVRRYFNEHDMMVGTLVQCRKRHDTNTFDEYVIADNLEGGTYNSTGSYYKRFAHFTY